MKIAMMGHKRIPSREGGVEIVVEELSTRMVQKGMRSPVTTEKVTTSAERNSTQKP